MKAPQPLQLEYVDFRESARYEASYQELLHDIHGKQMVAVPSLGPNPFVQLRVDVFGQELLDGLPALRRCDAKLQETQVTKQKAPNLGGFGAF